MNVLALCAGAGGMELGLKLALGGRCRTVCYVEREAYAAAVLVARMADKALDPAPVWDDLATFDGRPWRGVVDLVVAGYPCQPFSQAGKRLYEDDPRYIWPDVRRVIGEVEPAAVFLENNTLRAYAHVIPELEAAGLVVQGPIPATAAELGAGHIRRRYFVLAHLLGHELRLQPGRGCGESGEEAPEPGSILGDAEKLTEREQRQETLWDTGKEPRSDTSRTAWWEREPGVERVVHGVPDRVDIDRALGNAVVPLVAAHAWRTLAGRMT